LLKLAIFIGSIWFVWKELTAQEGIADVWISVKESFANGEWWLIGIAFLLVLVNWGSEGYKWKRLMKKEYPISLSLAVKAAFTGNATGIFTPNRIGGFVGRVMYLPKEQVLVGTMNTFVGNLSQLLATIIFGVVGAFVVAFFPIPIQAIGNVEMGQFVVEPLLFAGGFSLGLVLLLLVYFFPGALIDFVFRFKYFRKYNDRLNFLKDHSKLLLLEALGWSLFRYLVFAIQFYLLFIFFGADMNFGTCLMLIGLLYLTISLVPTLLGKLGFRELVVIAFFGAYIPEAEATSASLMLWMLNVALASIIGGILVLFVKKRE
jgi:uncharacterized membrane protein YbhN (UPF0104 family)